MFANWYAFEIFYNILHKLMIKSLCPSAPCFLDNLGYHVLSNTLKFCFYIWMPCLELYSNDLPQVKSFQTREFKLWKMYRQSMGLTSVLSNSVKHQKRFKLFLVCTSEGTLVKTIILRHVYSFNNQYDHQGPGCQVQETYSSYCRG